MVGGLDSRLLYTGLLAVVAAERGLELLVSRHNTERALERGGLELGRGHYPFLVALHTAFLVACALEVWLLSRPLLPRLALLCLLAVGAAMGLRYWVIATLGERWSTRVICEPGRAAVRRGPYRLLRHPNYLAVAIEIVALPLVHTAWLTALLFSLANALLLRVRIGVEEEGLRRHCAYDERFGRPAKG